MKTIIKKISILLLAFVLLINFSNTKSYAEGEESDVITILHTNDVHCGIDCYPKVAAYKASFTTPVALVDAGDHVQGEVIGTITSGLKIVEIMNASKYDLAVPGNHEFDYQMDAFFDIINNANYPYIAANFTKADGSTIDGADPYKILDLGNHKVGFVGIATPETYTKSTPVYFQDGNGNWVYTFNENSLVEKVQKAIDDATAAGAEIVIAVGHTGIDGTTDGWKASDIISNTTGIIAYIDGHSHETLTQTLTNQNGEDVTYQQTGTKLNNVGEITIEFTTDGASASAKLVPCEDLTDEDPDVKKIVEEAQKQVDDYFGQVVGHTNYNLTTKDAEGNRKVRSGETNLGDFNADAYRLLTSADITLMNGGGVRADIDKGDITLKDITAVNPWFNDMVKIEATGQQILNALEHGSRNYPEECGGFFQVSGLTYEINAHIKSSVITDDQDMFQGVEEGKLYRVQNVLVNGEPIDLNKIYTVASTSYILQQSGDGMTMFANTKVVEEYDDVDATFLVNYLTETLKGEVPAEYADIAGQGRIKIVDDHVYELVERLEPSTTTEGYEKYICSVCGEELIIPLEKLPAPVVETPKPAVVNTSVK